MARVRTVSERATSGRPHRTEVDCDWSRVNSPAGPLLQIASFGSDDRQIPGKVSQTLQFDRDAALALRVAIDAVFPNLAT